MLTAYEQKILNAFRGNKVCAEGDLMLRAKVEFPEGIEKFNLAVEKLIAKNRLHRVDSAPVPTLRRL